MNLERFEDIEATKVLLSQKDPDRQRQMLKSARSSMANIAEGFDSGSDPESARFLRISRWSAPELQSDLYVSVDNGFIDEATIKRRLMTF